MCVPFRSITHQLATTVVPIRAMRMSPIKWTLYFPMQMYVDWEKVRVNCISNTLRRRCCWKSTLRAHQGDITTRWRQRIMLRWNQWIGQHYTTKWFPKCCSLSFSHTRGWYADSRNVSRRVSDERFIDETEWPWAFAMYLFNKLSIFIDNPFFCILNW